MDESTVKTSQQSHDSPGSITVDSAETETTANDVTSGETTSPAEERAPAVDTVMTSVAPDGGYGWVIVVACFVLQVSHVISR